MAHLCGLTDVLDQLPEGYDTEVAEWGSSLSAGQRQRVALARAILRRVPLLFLDEATANIDVETEMAVLRRIFAEIGDTTAVFVTHRLASAALADHVCVLEAGQIQGFGTHPELLETCETYHRMVSSISSPEPHLRVLRESGS